MKRIPLVIVIAVTILSAACNQSSTDNVEGSPGNVVEKKAVKMDSDKFDVGKDIEGIVTETDSIHFGEIIEAKGALSIDDFAKSMEGEDTLNVKIEAIASEVCQRKGCWMKVKMSDGSSMRIRFKDYGFFVPKDISGRSVVFEGIAFKETISVEDLRHYAEDEGLSEDEIAAITKPEIKTSFLANGVLIR